MSWKCEYCGQKLKGTEKYCPNCANAAIYKCKTCGKVMDNGKHRNCPICNTEKRERNVDAVKKAGGAVGTLAVGAFMVAGKVAKFIGKKS